MAKGKSSVFFSKSARKVALSTKIDQSLKDRIDDLQKQLADVAPDLHFNTSAIVEAALLDAVEKGEAELAALGTKK